MDDSALKSIRVLYVDDDVALMRLVQKTLGRQGFEVTSVSSYAEAKAQITAGGVDIVALDHYLPGITGLDLLAQFIAIEGGPPVVYVTGSSEISIAVTALKKGAADFVPKTIGDDFLVLLASSLRQAVGNARLREQKEQAEREVRQARDRAEMLLAEVNHRVGNSLALVASMIQLQAKATRSDEAMEALREARARVMAVALVHQRLYTSGDVRSVALQEYLMGLLGHLSGMMGAEGRGGTLRHDIEDLYLPTDASINLGIIAAEWVVNAFKYAYPERPGEIWVRLRRISPDTVELCVEDEGVGRGEGDAKGTGLGSRIVQSLAMSLDGEVRYEARQPGTAARLVFRLENLA